LDDPQATLAVAGGKGASLARLCRAGLPVPGGFHVTTAAYRLFVEASDLQAQIMEVLGSADPDRPDSLESCSKAIRALFEQNEIPPEVAGDIARAYSELPGPSPSVAVRSSATAEDLPGLSFAGQQETYLNIHGPAAVIEAVQRCWASLWTPRAIGYRIRHGIDQGEISLAVVIQLLVPAETAGIMFTANPVTGARGEAVVSAAWGLGEAVVGGLVTPDTLTVDKATGNLLSRETADKQVKTVRTELGTEEQPVPETLRRVPILSDDQAAELVRLGIRIETLYDHPVDVEWAWVDGQFSIVQARPITALPEPNVAPPNQWTLPDPESQYMRTSIIDFMPDPLTPLFASMGLDAINRGLVRLLKVLVRTDRVAFPDNTIVTVNDYAYMSVKYTPRQWWWLATRLLPAFPRLLRTGVDRWRDEIRPMYADTVARWQDTAWRTAPAAEILSGVREILDAAVDHLGALQAGQLGAAAGSEGLFTAMYDRMLKRDDGPAARTFLMGFNTIPIQAEKALYELAQWCREQPDLAHYLLRMPVHQLAGQVVGGAAAPEDVEIETWNEWLQRIRTYLSQYGHSIYDLDFGKSLPADDPVPILNACKLFVSGEGTDPHARQQKLEAERLQAMEDVRARVRGLRRWAFEKSLGIAQKMGPLREDGIADIGLGYPLLRQMLRELGSRLVEASAIEERDDVFWLVRSELEQMVRALDNDESLLSMDSEVHERKARWEAERNLTPPPQLPAKEKFLGMNVDMWLAASAEDQAEGQIKGLGASPGQATATARVLHGPEEFDQMQPGDILVAGITTPAWTPLFAMASGIVTDIGGPLSHGSIVAREYGIPAVLGTGVATRRIRSGQTVTVDGSQGLVFLGEVQPSA